MKAWITFKDLMGNEFTIPKSVYDSVFANNNSFTLVQSSELEPKNEEIKKKEIIRYDIGRNEDKIIKKSPKKTI